MTASTADGRFLRSGVRAERAIVIGGSITGLLAARALTGHFSSVSLIERDSFPDGPDFRKGLPQMRHVHVLLKQGERVMEHYFPELLPELIAGGAHLIDMGGDLRWFNFGNWKTRFQSGVDFFCQTRGFLEWKIRQRVASLDGVSILDNCEVLGYTLDATGRVSGVRIRRAGETADDNLEAELVVDASGRGSRTPQWLDSLGFGKPTETEVRVDVGYASRFYRRPEKAPGDWSGLMIYPKPPGTRLGVLFPVEDNRWMVTLVGWFGDHPPTDEHGFREFAASLPVPDLFDAIRDAEPVSPIASHKFPSNRRRHYERMQRFPEGLVVLGDALCSFNPIYGQGMTTGALGVRLLDDSLRERRQNGSSARVGGFSRGFQRKIARVIDSPWLLTTTEDFRSPRTVGRRAWSSALLGWYTARIHRLTWSDRFTARRFLEVMHLTVRPTALFHPYIVFRALTQGFTRPKVAVVARETDGREPTVQREETRRVEMTTSPEKIVRDFCDAWSRKDIDELMSFFGADAVYHNIPVPAVTGTKAIRAAFMAFASLMDTIKLELLAIASNGNLVFTERIDRFRWDGKALDLPVSGVFEVRDGKIVAHRDYFDYETWMKATGIPLG